MSVGSSTIGVGDGMLLDAGRGTVHTGGAVHLASGEGTATSSGAITIRSINSGTSGVSGALILNSSTSVSGNSGRHDLAHGGHDLFTMGPARTYERRRILRTAERFLPSGKRTDATRVPSGHIGGRAN